jgi:hypothetical protein
MCSMEKSLLLVHRTSNAMQPTRVHSGVFLCLG